MGPSNHVQRPTAAWSSNPRPEALLLRAQLLSLLHLSSHHHLTTADVMTGKVGRETGYLCQIKA